MTRTAPIDADRLRGVLADWAEPGAMLTVALADAIARLVACGTLTAGSRLPAALALSKSLGVSRPTVADAYDLLSVQGTIDKRSRVIIGHVAPHLSD